MRSDTSKLAHEIPTSNIMHLLIWKQMIRTQLKVIWVAIDISQKERQATEFQSI